MMRGPGARMYSKPDRRCLVLTQKSVDRASHHPQAENVLFNGTGTFRKHGGLGSIDAAAEDGFVLVLSVWDDFLSRMLWLDSTFPTNSTQPGAKRGPCATDSGDPSQVRQSAAGKSAAALYSNLRFGEIGTTDAVFPPAPPMPPSPPPPPACAKAYGQCGGTTPSGKPWTGPACCPYGYACTGNKYYKGCTPSAATAEADGRFVTYSSKSTGR